MSLEYTSTIKDTKYCLEFRGKFTFSDNETVQHVLTEFKSTNCSECEISLAGLSNIDSAGLGMLLLINDAITESGKSIHIHGAAGQVLKMLEISKFSEVIDIRP